MKNRVRPIRLLLIDDHKSFIDGLTMIIGTNKDRMEVVATATNRESALAEAARAQPDLVLLDINMHGNNGLEFLPELISASETKVLILTGNRDSAVHEGAMLAGARGILLKTEPAQVILKAIEKVNDGELWLSNIELSRVFDRLSNRQDKDETVDWDQEKINSLTEREREIIRAIVKYDSLTNREIAGNIFISESTLKNHVSTIYSKLELRNRIDLLKYAKTHDLAELVDLS